MSDWETILKNNSKASDALTYVCVEDDKRINPRYGIVQAIVDSETNSIVKVGRVDYPLVILPGERLPKGYAEVPVQEVVNDTKRGIRYVTIYSTSKDTWTKGRLVHSDGEKYISTNPDKLSSNDQENLGPLVFNSVFE